MVLLRFDLGVMPFHGLRLSVLSTILTATTPAPESSTAIIYMLGAKYGNFSAVRIRAKAIDELMQAYITASTTTLSQKLPRVISFASASTRNSFRIHMENMTESISTAVSRKYKSVTIKSRFFKVAPPFPIFLLLV